MTLKTFLDNKSNATSISGADIALTPKDIVDVCNANTLLRKKLGDFAQKIDELKEILKDNEDGCDDNL